MQHRNLLKCVDGNTCSPLQAVGHFTRTGSPNKFMSTALPGCLLCRSLCLQFRALADQLYYRESRHAEVRQAVVDQLCCHADRYRDYVTTDYKEYVR